MIEEPKKKVGDGRGNWIDLPFAPSLRDYFAGQALNNLAGHKIEPFNKKTTFTNIAEQCYMYADEMIKERNKGE